MPKPSLLRTMNRRRIASAFLAISALALAACTESHSQGDPTPPPPQVTVVTMRGQAVTLSRELPGRVRASLVAEVRPQVGGIVRRVMFTEGGLVKAGQSLYELDSALYQAQFDSAKASLDKAQATQHAARLAAARSAELIRIEAVSAQDNESAIAAEAQARADVAVAQAAVETARVNLAYTRIVAPISGRIGKSSVTQGALVTAEQAAALATIQQLDPAYVEVNQSSSNWLALKQAVEAGRVRSDATGATTKLILENGSAYANEGKLQFSDASVDPATGNLLVRAVVPNPKFLLLPGMYVRAVIDEGAVPQGILVPQQGISLGPKGNASALLVGKDGKVESRTVHVSRAIADQWLVEDGLAAGDRVIVEGVQKADPGTLVRALERAPGQPLAASANAPASAAVASR